MSGTGSLCLSGLRVVDLTDLRGQLAGRILADLGAEVILVEPRGGDPERAVGPLVDGLGAAWVARNLGKRGVEIDLGSAVGGERLRALIARADVLIENFDDVDYRVLELEGLRQGHPSLVVCSISPYGRSGPRSAHRGSDLTALAASGNLFLTGDPDRPPLRCSKPVSDYHGGAEAAAAILMALYRRDRTGDGDHVDVSLQELMVMANVSHTAQAWATEYQGRRSGGAYRVGESTQREIWPCQDGYVTFALRGGRARIPGLIAMTEFMTEEGMAPPALRDRDWSAYNHNVLSQDEVDELSDAFGAFFRTKTMAELYDAACERRLMLAPANSEAEVLASRQLASRDFFATVSGAAAHRVPARFAGISGVPSVALQQRLPERGDAIDFVGPGLAPPSHASVAPGGGGSGIFAGLKIVEFGAGAAAPLATRYFADQGATVVKIESKRRPDFLRTLRDDGSGTLDNSLFFACINPNKLSAGLNMKDPRGLALARRLVGWADVVVENFAPGVMDRWGLDYDSVRGEFPGLIMASTCLWGQTGPERAYPGFGGQGAALAGFNHLTGWADREPLGPFGTITDSLSPRFATVAITAALLRRDRTGLGAYIDVSQVETGVYCTTDWLLAFQASGRSFGRVGNRSSAAVPHVVLPTLGDDRWIALAVHTDDDWRRLCGAMSDPEWAVAPSLEDLAGRQREREMIETNIAEWTASQDGAVLAHRLQEAGIDAAVVADMQDVLADPQLVARGHFTRLDHPVVGEHVVESIGARFASSPMTFRRPAPCLAADSEHVYLDLLGLPRAEFDELRQADVLS